eukprot:3927_1
MSESPKWTYKWQITDPSMLKQMKNAKNMDEWTSPIFSACSFRWRLEVLPNGYNEATEGSTNFFVRLVFLPPKVQSIVVALKYGLLEVRQITNSTKKYDKPLSYGWHSNLLPAVKLKNLNTLTFVAKIELVAVFDKND